MINIDQELVNLVEYKIGLPIEEIIENYLKALVYYDVEEPQESVEEQQKAFAQLGGDY